MQRQVSFPDFGAIHRYWLKISPTLWVGITMHTAEYRGMKKMNIFTENKSFFFLEKENHRNNRTGTDLWNSKFAAETSNIFYSLFSLLFV